MSLKFQLNTEQQEAFVLALSQNDNKAASFTKLELTPLQQEKFVHAMNNRAQQEKPHILIIEDQDFSRKLLQGLLQKNYPCHAAKNSQQALQFFSEHAPNIIFIDIELPDQSGHGLARLFKILDPSAHIVMVTGNNYITDIETAKKNKTDGFIVKPYAKTIIMAAIDNYNKIKKVG
jgi:CheY-like chemotaxis protein